MMIPKNRAKIVYTRLFLALYKTSQEARSLVDEALSTGSGYKINYETVIKKENDIYSPLDELNFRGGIFINYSLKSR